MTLNIISGKELSLLKSTVNTSVSYTHLDVYKRQVTDNQLPIDGGISESGSYTLTKRTAVKNTPSDTAPVEFYLEAGDKINFDMKVTQDGHSWISYISYSGCLLYTSRCV